MALVEVRDLHVHYPVRKGLWRRTAGLVRAVDGVSFQIDEGETLGLVGESGSGKSTTGRAVMGLLRPTGGTVSLDGKVLQDLTPRELRRERRNVQMIFQDPFASLNPRATVGAIVREPLDVHEVGAPASRAGRVTELLESVGLGAAHAGRYPHEFSGGQRQRIGIARALATSPRLIVADEPISALDVSIQAQVVNLMTDLKGELGLTYLFIAHDLAMVRHISDRVAVMLSGKLVEVGSRDRVFGAPSHPYTRMLLESVPRPGVSLQARVQGGDLPASPVTSSPDPGCVFRKRCPFAEAACATEVPQLAPVGGEESHRVACLRAAQLPPWRDPGGLSDPNSPTTKSPTTKSPTTKSPTTPPPPPGAP